jgi:hypothetical protein
MANTMMNEAGIPTNVGIAMEIVRRSGLYNMVMDGREMIRATAATAVYLGLPVDLSGNIGIWRSDFMAAYAHPDFGGHVARMADSLPSGSAYREAQARWDRSTPCSTPKELVEEALRECLGWAAYARAEEPWERLVKGRELQYGIQRMAEEGQVAPPVPPPARKTHMLRGDDGERESKRRRLE